MVNKIANGIIDAIYNGLGNDADKYHYYTDGIRQNFETPCFYPKPISPRLIKRAGKGYEYNVMFVVHYFPEDPLNKTDMSSIGDVLLRCLQTITIVTDKIGANGSYSGQQILRATDVNFTLNEDRVLCYATYHLLVQESVQAEISMGDIEFGETIK